MKFIIKLPSLIVFVVLICLLSQSCDKATDKNFKIQFDSSKKVSAQKLPDMPMAAAYENTMEYEWSQKKVFDSLLLSDTENLNNWHHEGFGDLKISTEKFYKGKSSLLLTSPTKGKESAANSRPWGSSGAYFSPVKADWSDWNRISFWIYPDLPGFKVASISMVFNNDGEDKVPGPYDRNGLNFQMLKNHAWNKVYWEIDHLGRDKVKGIEIRYRLQGNEPGATESVKYYIDEVYLEKVVPDYFEGWEVAPNHIAYNHIGYVTDLPKIALASSIEATSFKIVNTLTGKSVLEKAIEIKTSGNDTFQVMDFSEILTPGTYVLEASAFKTKSFIINEFNEVYRNTILKTINHFYTQRCGIEVSGIHAACHLDWQSSHNGKSIIINGGWHDAGDLSQGVKNTAEGAYAMLVLADKLRSSDLPLANRLIDEAKCGLDWILKTRFGDGYRHTWGTMDFWTDGIIGTSDDAIDTRVNNEPIYNFLASKTEAKAAISFADRDKIFAKYNLESAEYDWSYADKMVRESIKDNSVNIGISSSFHKYESIAGAGLNASLELYEATSNTKYKDAALFYADYIMSCQQKGNIADNISLQGFFYTSPSKEHILHYDHLSHEQDIAVGLVRLCTYFPNDKNLGKWKEAIVLYAEYYKQISKNTGLYSMIPAGIYDLNATTDEILKEQIKAGIKLNNQYYLRNFPIWKAKRGNSGTILSQAKGLSAIANYLGDKDLLALIYKQLDWHMGLNPFCQSLMYGVGYRFAGQYSVTSGNLVGGLPVGVQTHFNRDKPYWPTENCYNWKEIWVQPSGRWLWLMTDFY